MSGRHLVEIDDEDMDCVLRLAHDGETIGQTMKRLLFAIDCVLAAQIANQQPKPVNRPGRQPRRSEPVIQPKAGDSTTVWLRARYRTLHGRDWPGNDGALARVWAEERDRLLPRGSNIRRHNSAEIREACLARMERHDWRKRASEGREPA